MTQTTLTFNPDEWVLVPRVPTEEQMIRVLELSEKVYGSQFQAWGPLSWHYVAMLSAAPKPEGGDGWLDISTAPKDGTHIIVSGGIAYWRTNNTYPKLSGWFTLTGVQYPGKPIQWDVTKWQPFPDLPQTPTKKEK